MTAPRAPVKPVVAALTELGTSLDAARPKLIDAHASEWLLGEVDRVRSAGTTLRDSLIQLVEQDGMKTFDPAFAADDVSWDAWFAESAEVVDRAQGFLDAQAGVAAIASTTSV